MFMVEPRWWIILVCTVQFFRLCCVFEIIHNFKIYLKNECVSILFKLQGRKILKCFKHLASKQKIVNQNEPHSTNKDVQIASEVSSSLGVLCSWLYIAQCKAIYKDINNFPINFGFPTPGPPLEILRFLITISPECPTVGEMLHIYIFPQMT